MLWLLDGMSPWVAVWLPPHPGPNCGPPIPDTGMRAGNKGGTGNGEDRSPERKREGRGQELFSGGSAGFGKHCVCTIQVA